MPIETMPPHLNPSLTSDPHAESGTKWRRKILIFFLAAISWFATFTGLCNFILADPQPLSVEKIIVGVVSAILMTAIIFFLNGLSSNISLLGKSCYLLAYLILTAISVGFGFGFYWHLLASKDVNTVQVEQKTTFVTTQFETTKNQLTKITDQLDNLVKVSDNLQEQERKFGDSCGSKDAKSGNGPKTRLRIRDSQNIKTWSTELKSLVSAINIDIRAMESDANALLKTPATSNVELEEQYRQFNRDLREKVRNINNLDHKAAFTLEQIKKRAEQEIHSDDQGKRRVDFTCEEDPIKDELNNVLIAFNDFQKIDNDLQLSPPTLSNSIKEAIYRLIHLRLESLDYLALILAAIIDGCIFIISKWGSKENKDSEILDNVFGQMPALTKEIFSQHLYHVRNKQYLIAFNHSAIARAFLAVADYDDIEHLKNVESKKFKELKAKFTQRMEEQNNDPLPPIQMNDLAIYQLKKELGSRLLRLIPDREKKPVASPVNNNRGRPYPPRPRMH